MIKRSLLVLLLALSSLAPARAQTETDQPIMGSQAVQEQPGVPETESVENTYRILVIGDALAGGLGAGLDRMAQLVTGFEVQVRFKEESGIARSEVYDWGAALRKILEGNDFDAVVVLLGANDRQGIRDGVARLVFNTPEWVQAYQSRTDRILNVLAEAGVDVFWVSLPPMADPEYEAAMQAIAKLQKERVEAKGARFVDIRAAFLTPEGSYTDRGPDDTGEIRKLRSRDGVTFFKQGNNRLGQLVLAAIQQTQKGDAIAPSAAVGEQPNLPLFGQGFADGTEITLRAPDVKVADVLTSGAAGPGTVGSLAALRSLAVPGSAAEKLFSLGETAPAPAGRVDDFRLPQ